MPPSTSMIGFAIWRGVPPERERGLDTMEYWMEQLHADDRERVLDLRRQLHDDVTQRLAGMAPRNTGVASFQKYDGRN